MYSLSPARDDPIAYTAIPSPLGTMWIAAGPRGLLHAESFMDELEFCCAVERDGFGTPQRLPDSLDGIARELAEYFEGRRTVFEMPLDLSGLTPFRRAVLEAVAAVPYGTVQSYQDIAFRVGKPGATRAVGCAVATNPISIVIPCHRIIRADGTPGEYALRTLGRRGVVYKLMLLELEGVSFP